MLPPTVKWSGIIAKAQTRAPKYLSWRMTARSEWTYLAEWCDLWRDVITRDSLKCLRHWLQFIQRPPWGSIIFTSQRRCVWWETEQVALSRAWLIPPRKTIKHTCDSVKDAAESVSIVSTGQNNKQPKVCSSLGVFLLFPFLILLISVQNYLLLICQTRILDFLLHSTDF